MKNLSFLASLSLLVVASAFSPFPSSFTGRATSVCSRDELTTELSCPPSRTRSISRGSMSMPPFLKKLGLKKPENPFFGGNKEKEEEEPSSVAVLDGEPEPEPAKDTVAVDEECIVPEDEEELSETQKLMKQVKESGTAGVVSYALWELAFWAFSVPVCVFGYREVTGHWPDFNNQEDLQKLGAEAFAFVNFARFAVPLRIGLALSTTPWIQDNVVDKFFSKDESPVCEEPKEE
mmetsp:Transcript_3612/g.5287  ORF Transcript_3612/g.5287 Transcript_3612/m.5287 type:complete len:234 (+) Transcript_3612:167-868(+)